MAHYQFRRVAGAAWEAMKQTQRDEDWRQEIHLAALLAERSQCPKAEAFRLFGRCATAALRGLGFRRFRREKTYRLRP
jgi:hypothetical protein